MVNYSESTFISTYLSCVSVRGGSGDCLMDVVVTIDSFEHSNTNVMFLYTPDPVLTDVSPQEIIPALEKKNSLTFLMCTLQLTSEIPVCFSL